LAASVHIIVCPSHVIIVGIPIAIIFIIDSHRSRSASMPPLSIGMSLHTIPSLPISMVIRQSMGIVPMPDIIGIMPIPGIIPMPGIIGIIMGIPMPDIIGIIIPIPGIPIPGIPMAGIPMAGMPIQGIPMPGIIIWLWGMGIVGMFMAGIMIASSLFTIGRPAR
jgi:hypothetical protein